MVRLAAQPHTIAAQADDRRDDADIDVLGLEHRALLDVELEVRPDVGDAGGRVDAVEVEACRSHRVAERDAVGVDPVSEVAHVLAGEGPAAEEGSVEARALLVHEGDYPERPLGLEALLLQQPDGVEGGDHAERAVEASAAGDGVEVRADRDGRARTGLPAADEVPGRVDLDLEAELPHLVADPAVRCEELRRPGERA